MPNISPLERPRIASSYCTTPDRETRSEVLHFYWFCITLFLIMYYTCHFSVIQIHHIIPYDTIWYHIHFWRFKSCMHTKNQAVSFVKRWIWAKKDRKSAMPFLPLSAERLGFEPRVPVRVRRISSAVHSTTLASLRSNSSAKVRLKIQNSKFEIQN